MEKEKELKNNKYQFKKIFSDRLRKIKTLPKHERGYKDTSLEKFGIKKIKRSVPALIFEKKEGFKNEDGLEIWILDSKKIRNWDYIHEELKEDLKKEFDLDNNFTLGGEIIEDGNGNLYLLTDPIRSKQVEEYFNLAFLDRKKQLIDVIQRYGINKVIGDSRDCWYDEVLINEDLLGQRREERFLYSFSKKYKMTNTQYLRFTARTKSLIEARKKGKKIISSSFDEIAKDIVGNENEKI